MALTPGSTFGPYQIRSLLGAGGMGEVYRAYDPKLNRDVALKVLPEALVRDAGRLRRFELEARSASALNHPAIVAIYDLGDIDHHHYMTMELVEGQTLREILAPGAMPVRRALQIAAQVADGLAKAHDAGIVHRDVKPENLMVSHDGFAKILDFGLAKLTVETSAGQVTKTEHATTPGTVMGTVSYMSPEQAQGLALDSRSDQFSFGLVLYELLSGRRPFARLTPPETLAAVIRDEPPALAEIAPQVPPPIRWIVDRCLSKSPGDRYASTRDLARDLANARDHLSELSGSGGATALSRPRHSIASREIAAWAVALLALVALVTLWARRDDRQAGGADVLTFTFPAPEGTRFVSNVGLSPFAISPDGRSVAFVAGPEDGPRQLWIHSFDSLGYQSIAGTNGAANPFWSPDGKWVGFFTQSQLKRASVAGGNVATICEAAAGGGGGTWNKEDVILFTPGLQDPIYRVSAAGSAPVAVTHLDTAHKDSGHISPVFLPDGRRFVFAVFGGDRPGTYLGSIDGSTPTRLSPDISMLGVRAPDELFFVRARTLFSQHLDLDRASLDGEPVRVADDVLTQGPTSMFSVATSGAVVYWTGGRTITQPTWFSRKGESLGTVGRPGGYVNLSISPDGAHVLADRFDPAPGIWDLDVARGTATRQTSSPLYQSTPLWRPDGKAFAFASASGDAPPNLYLKELNGAEERLTTSAVQSFPQSWSPDGRSLIYITVEPKTGRDLLSLPLSGDRKPTPLLQSAYSEAYGRVSPDGRWLAYVSNESGPSGVFVTQFPVPEGKWQVSRGGASMPIWSRDGREIFYFAFDNTLTAVPVAAAATEFAAGTPVKLFMPKTVAFSSVGVGSFYDVAGDGRFLINMLVERTSPPAAVILNWKAPVTPRP